MQQCYPVAAKMFRQYAQELGISLSDPAEPLGTVERCRHALEQAGFIPERFVSETVRFSRVDLKEAWQVNAGSPHHTAVRQLTANELDRFRDRYHRALEEKLAINENLVLDAWVIYAFGRKGSA